MRSRVILAIATLGLGLATFPLPVTSATPAAVSQTAVDGSAARITACREEATKKGSVKVDLLFVIDTSLSLRESDPFGITVRDPARVRAMESVIAMLRTDSTDDTQLSSAVNPSTQIRVNFLDFGSRVRPSFATSRWQRIDEFDAQTLKSFGAKDDDPDTDYVGALVDPEGVVEVLTAAARESDCQVVLWFTDGKFDFDAKTGLGPRNFAWLEAELGTGRSVVRDRNTAAVARQVGEKILCEKSASRQRAVADDLRALDRGGALTVIGIGLNISKAADNFALLKRLLESPDCGTLKPVGFMVEVTSADDLSAAMRKALFPNIDARTVCDISTIADGASFYIAEPVKRADLFLRARDKVSEIQLIRLGGDQSVVLTLFKNGVVRPAESLEGIRVSTRQLDASPTLETVLDFTVPTGKWVGDWVLRACNETGLPAEIDADVVIRGCIAFDLAAGNDMIVVGRSSNLFLVLKRCGEDASRLSTVRAISLEAVVLIDGKRVKAVLSENESLLEVPFAPTEASLGGSTSKKIKLQVVEVNATYEVLEGTRPVVLEWSKDNNVFDIALRLPPKTPYVEKISCKEMLEQSRSTTCEFRAVAKDAVGRISTDGAMISPAAALGGEVNFMTTSSAKFPLTVRPGQPESFFLTFNLSGVRTNESVIAQPFEVTFSYETDGEPIETGTISGEFAIEPNLSVSIDRLRALLFALAGLIAAVSIFAVARFVFASIQVPAEGLLWGGCIDIPRCDPETVRGALNRANVQLDALPINSSRKGVRSVSELGMVGDCNLYLRARAGWRLLSELGYVAATHPEFPVVASEGIVVGGFRQSRAAAGRTSLNLVGQWWLIPQGSVDGQAETSDEVRSRLESLPGKFVFVSTSAEPPQVFFSDLGFSVAGSVALGLSQVADQIWIRPRTAGIADNQSAASGRDSTSQVPEI